MYFFNDIFFLNFSLPLVYVKVCISIGAMVTVFANGTEDQGSIRD